MFTLFIACGVFDGTTPTDTGAPPSTESVPPDPGPPDADLSDASVVLAFTAASAAQAYFGPYNLLYAYTDDACPAWTVDGTTRVGTGGCVDSEGVEWFGSVTSSVSEITQVGTIEFSGFGYRASVACPGGGAAEDQRVATGVAAYRPDGFDVALDSDVTVLDLDACAATPATTSLTYSGEAVPAGGDTQYVGVGEYVHSVYGRADVWTIDELLDGEACSTEAASGVTLLSTADHDAAVVYDGRFDCDPESTVRWELDGHAQGELVGVSCASTGVSPGTGAVLLAAALVRRRRRA